MNKKGLLILCVIFAVLIGLVFVKGRTKPQVSTQEEITDIISTVVSVDSINEIELKLGSGTPDESGASEYVHLVKDGDYWFDQTQLGVYASDSSITALLKKLDGLTGELRSNNKEVLGDYGMDDANGVHVQLRGENNLNTHLIVGTQKAGFVNNFVRKAGSNAVYIVGENILATLGVRAEDDDQKLDTKKWTDKRIAHIDAGEVEAVVITEFIDGKEETAVNIKKELIDDKKQWKSQIPYDFGLSASKIKSMIEGFNNTYAREVKAVDEGGAFDEIGWTGAFTMANGENVKIIRALQPVGNDYYIMHEGAGYMYQVPMSTFNSRRDKQGAIFINNSLKVDENSIERIEINTFDPKKYFSAVKKPAPEVDDAPQGEGDNQEKPKEDSWVTSGGEALEVSKVREIINKLKFLSIEADLKPPVSIKNSMSIGITKDGKLTEYSISKDMILKTGKECRFLNVKGNAQSYCAVKSTVVALQNALP